MLLEQGPPKLKRIEERLLLVYGIATARSCTIVLSMLSKMRIQPKLNFLVSTRIIRQLKCQQHTCSMINTKQRTL